MGRRSRSGPSLTAAAAALLGARRAPRNRPPVAGIGALTRLAFYDVRLAAGGRCRPSTRSRAAIERRADRFAVAATRDPHSGARAFRRLRDQNLAEDEQPRWAELLFSSHPSLRSRIEALETATG